MKCTDETISVLASDDCGITKEGLCTQYGSKMGCKLLELVVYPLIEQCSNRPKTLNLISRVTNDRNTAKQIKTFRGKTAELKNERIPQQ